jgi:hypothetical protein
MHQLDVNNAFLYGTLTETAYFSQPADFVNPTHPKLVCRLNKSLYGLKQVPRAWYYCFASYLVSLGFVEAKVRHLVVRLLWRRRHYLLAALRQ